jgi:hypothetical protein
LFPIRFVHSPKLTILLILWAQEYRLEPHQRRAVSFVNGHHEEKSIKREDDQQFRVPQGSQQEQSVGSLISKLPRIVQCATSRRSFSSATSNPVMALSIVYSKAAAANPCLQVASSHHTAATASSQQSTTRSLQKPVRSSSFLSTVSCSNFK